MGWTSRIDTESMMASDKGMCVVYALEASLIARREGRVFDLNSENWRQKYFGGVQPTQAEFLKFLSAHGFDSEEIESNVKRSILQLRDKQIEEEERAKRFLALFEEKWHVSEKDVSDLIDENTIYYVIEYAIKNAGSMRARLKALERYKKDPKQEEKRFIKDCWKKWQERPSLYRGPTDFARDMFEKVQHLESGDAQTILKWCRSWKKEAESFKKS